MKIVLTGGPCAGKTTLANLLGQAFSSQAVVVPEAASLLFSGGFPRWPEPAASDAIQRAIYHVQCQMETVYTAHYPSLDLILDRGTIDGASYWSSGVENYFSGVGTTLKAELSRYNHVIYLESAGEQDYPYHKSKNRHRTESWDEAHALDMLARKIWSQHSSFFVIKNNKSFDLKIEEVFEILNGSLRKNNKAA
jgi:predicted ATPase